MTLGEWGFRGKNRREEQDNFTCKRVKYFAGDAFYTPATNQKKRTLRGLTRSRGGESTAVTVT